MGGRGCAVQCSAAWTNERTSERTMDRWSYVLGTEVEVEFGLNTIDWSCRVASGCSGPTEIRSTKYLTTCLLHVPVWLFDLSMFCDALVSDPQRITYTPAAHVLPPLSCPTVP